MACGFMVAAADAPGHGERPRTEHGEGSTAIVRQRTAVGEASGPLVSRDNAERAVLTCEVLAVPE
jgi:hypothetical protein